MIQTGNERELQLVNRYLEEHFNPIRRLLGHKIPDPEVRAIAIRRCTRHIFHWHQDARPEHGTRDIEEPVEPSHVMDDNGSMQPEEDLLDDVDIAELPADKRPPEQWATSGDSATPRQLAVLRDHDIGIPEDCTKARASQLITQHVYGGASA